MRTRPLLLAVALAVPVCILPGSGCQNGSLREIFGRDAMALLAPALKDAANRYIASLKSLASQLAGVRSLQDALNVAPKIEPAARDAKAAYDTLSAASPQERELLWEAFGATLNEANRDFLSQSARVKDESLWGRALAAGLEQVQLFQE
ncbi:MAG TPA: hypothetical protein VFF65_13680 [Phycisphaerales bacterium]|nr:hypothetical protein [Phycisphaerales bacterium]